MMSVFLLSLNFNIWQFATKHICYSNIYTTYIAIYVTSQQKMVSKWKQNKTNKQQQNKTKRDPYSMVGVGGGGRGKIITKFWHGKSVHESTVREMWLCNKKEGHLTLFQLLNALPTVSCFKFSFLLFFPVKWLIDAFLEMKLCIHLFMRSTQYTEWNPGFSERKDNKKICLFKTL